MNGDDAPAEEPAAAAPAEPEEPLGQDDIDALLAEMNGNDAPVEAGGGSGRPEGPLGQDDIDSLLAEMNGGEEAQPSQEASDGPLGQDDIDAMLAEMSGEVEAVKDDGSQKTDVVSETERINSDLSQEEIDSLVDKQGAGDEDSEALIDQNDIDALVRQMSEATSPPAAEHVTDMLEKRGGDIEVLLNEAAKNVDTSDAISEIASFDQAASSGEKVVYGPPVNAMAPEELRGTRFLLAAAVFLLAMCTAAMVFVVSSINRLSGELHANRETVTTPTDDYSEDLQVATEYAGI